MTNSTKTTKKFQKLNFVQRAILFCQGGDEANIKETVHSIIRTWEDNINVAKRNIKRIKEDCVTAIEDKNRDLADANRSLKEAYLYIDPSIDTNAKRKAYQSVYEKQISSANYEVARIEKAIKSLQEDCDEAVKIEKSQMDAYVIQLDKLTSEEEVEIEVSVDNK